jgi:hypothetical protein
MGRLCTHLLSLVFAATLTRSFHDMALKISVSISGKSKPNFTFTTDNNLKSKHFEFLTNLTGFKSILQRGQNKKVDKKKVHVTCFSAQEAKILMLI